MITTGERTWIWRFALAVIVFTSIPYALGFALQGSEWRFSGFVFGVEDGNSYIAKMLSGSAGEWLFRTPYTAYPQPGVLAFLPYILLGKLASPTGLHEQLIALFQLFRWGAIVLYAFAAYRFIAIFINQVRLRRAALILAFLGGGLGFLSAFGMRWSGWDGLPLEFYSPECFGFLAVFGLPHITAGRAFLLWGLARILKHQAGRPIWRDALLAGLLWLLLGLMQPLTVVVAWVVAGAGLAAEWIAWRFRVSKGSAQAVGKAELTSRTRLALLAALISSPLPAYTFLAFALDPFLKSWSAQNLILSPPPLDYLLSYALILPFVIAGVARGIKDKAPNAAFLMGWLALFPFLAYAPYNLQRRLPEGIWVCMVILALLAVELDRMPLVWKRFHPVLYLGVLSSLFFYVGGLKTVTAPRQPVYAPVGAVRAYASLEKAAGDAFPVVLSDYLNSNALPAWSPVRTVVGHGPESKDLKVLQPLVESFLDGSLEQSAAHNLLVSQRVQFVLASPEYPLDFTARYPSLELFDQQDGYRIFAVDLSKSE